jgi:hypothetical protein
MLTAIGGVKEAVSAGHEGIMARHVIERFGSALLPVMDLSREAFDCLTIRVTVL